MAQVIVDPSELRAFAAFLRQWVSRYRDHEKALETTRHGLNEVWRDVRAKAFENAYVPTQTQMKKLCRTAEDYADHLSRKAERAERFLRRR